MFDLPALEATRRAAPDRGGRRVLRRRRPRRRRAGEAGWPFFGQYVAHDLTADRSPLRAHTDLGALRNMRSPRANLESLYGGGPVGSPYLYQSRRPGEAARGRRRPAAQPGGDRARRRSPQRHARVHEPDAGRLHPRPQPAGRPAARRRVREPDLFDEARRALTWHYQWLIVNDLLPGWSGTNWSRAAARRTALLPAEREPFMPVEFADAAYRYGHSQIRELYRLQPTGRCCRSSPT